MEDVVGLYHSILHEAVLTLKALKKLWMIARKSKAIPVKKVTSVIRYQVLKWGPSLHLNMVVSLMDRLESELIKSWEFDLLVLISLHMFGMQ